MTTLTAMMMLIDQREISDTGSVQAAPRQQPTAVTTHHDWLALPPVETVQQVDTVGLQRRGTARHERQLHIEAERS